MPQQINEIAKGVQTLFLPNNAFNTTLVSFNFYLPLNKETVSRNALLPELISTCSADYPDYLKLNYRLSDLYGADVVSSVTKVGNCICIKFSLSSINNRFAFGGESVVEDSINLLLNLIFRPKIKDNAFCEEDVKREKRKLIDRIKGDLNEKRTYARNRLIAEMFEGDPYGIYRLGRAEDVEAVTGKELYEAWKEMLETAFLRVHIIGEEMPQGLEEKIKGELSAFSRHDITDIYQCSSLSPRQQVKRVSEFMDVAQGKLVMGFSCPGGDDDSTLDLMMMCDIFGGGPYSRLFTNVREKMSLCYYCSASAVRNKGYLMVDCGVEKENAKKAEEAILSQLQVIKNGEFNDFEFSSSLKSIRDSLKSYHDSQNGLDVWYTIKAINKNIYSPEEISEKLDLVTKEDVIKVAEKVKYNTIFSLMPKEMEEN